MQSYVFYSAVNNSKLHYFETHSLQSTDANTDKAAAKASATTTTQTRKRAADSEFSEPDSKKPATGKSSHLQRVSYHYFQRKMFLLAEWLNAIQSWHTWHWFETLLLDKENLLHHLETIFCTICHLIRLTSYHAYLNCVIWAYSNWCNI